MKLLYESLYVQKSTKQIKKSRRLGLFATKNLRVEMKYLHSIEITLGKFMTYTYFDTDISLKWNHTIVHYLTITKKI